MSESAFPRRTFLFASAAMIGLRPSLFAAADPKALQAVQDKGYAFLKSKQQDDGSFAPPQVGEPGITALVIAGLVRSGKPTTDDVVGKAFDPEWHEAVTDEPANGRADGEVTAELRRGYRIGTKLLRAAMVKVAKA